MDATVTVVDALNFESSLADYAIAADQVAAADVLLLNKSDPVDEARLEQVKRQLGRLKANAPVCVTRCGISWFPDLVPFVVFRAKEDRSSSSQKFEVSL